MVALMAKDQISAEASASCSLPAGWQDHGAGVTSVVNLKGHRGDPAYADVVYVGRAMHRGGWWLAASPLASPFRLGRMAAGRRWSVCIGSTCSGAHACWRCCRGCAGGGWGAGATRSAITLR